MCRRFAIVLVCFLAAGCSGPPEPDGLKCKVIKIVDGDTIKILDAQQITRCATPGDRRA